MPKRIEHEWVDGVEHKWCYGHGLFHPVTDFKPHPSKWDGLRSACPAWERFRANEWQAANREKSRLASARRREKNPSARAKRAFRKRRRDWFRDLKESAPCIDCGVSYPSHVMQWDHLPQYTKEYDIAQMVHKGVGKDLILREIEKCELVCANCHALRTHRRKGNDCDRVCCLAEDSKV